VLKSKRRQILDDEIVDLIFGEWIRARRGERKYKARTVAQKTNIPEWRILEIESGEGMGVTPKEALEFSKRYDISYTKILNIAAGGVYVGEMLDERMH
jgi:hypothetical protein